MRTKRKFAAVFLAFCMMLLAFVPAFAAELETNSAVRVYDLAGLFTAEEKASLQNRSEEIQENWQMDMVFLTTESTHGIEAKRYAADFYEQNGFGIGADYSGIIMIVDMGGRDAQIVTCGRAITVFTDYYIDRIWNDMRSQLSEGEYFAAMETLCDSVEHYNAEYIKYQENPSYVSEYQMKQEKRQTALLLGAAGLFSLITAGIGVAFMRRGSRNIKPFTDGRAYLKDNGVNITVDKNTFASTHTARTPIPKNNNNNRSGGSWGGGSSTFRSSGGRSFGGGGGRF